MSPGSLSRAKGCSSRLRAVANVVRQLAIQFNWMIVLFTLLLLLVLLK
jgi:hypothetical protein